MHTAIRTLLTVCVALALSPFALAQQPAAQPTADPAADAEQTDDAEPITSVAPPASLAGKQLAWVMSVLNGGDTGSLVGRFTPDMLKELTEARIKESLLAIRDNDLGGPPIHLVEIEARSTEFAITGFVFGPRRKMSVFLAVDDETGLISGLRFSRAGYLRSRAGDWDAYTGDLGRRKGLLSFGAYEVVIVPGTPGTPASPATEDTPASPAVPATPDTFRLVAIHTIDDHKALSISSASRVFIHAALVDAVEKKELDWFDELAIDDAKKSLPPGVMQNDDAGTKYPLSRFADRMIALNDHTAADHLFHHITRDRIERAAKAHCESPIAPFLSTREHFQLRLPPDRELLAEFVEADEGARRTLLKDKVAAVPLNIGEQNLWDKPLVLQEVGWHASAWDMSSTMASLHLAASRWDAASASANAKPTNPISAPFTKFSAVRLNRAHWTSAWYIGGGEPGVLSMNWLLTRNDGRLYALSITWNNPTDVLEEDRLQELAGVGLDLLWKHGRKEEE
jgi:hypothetical protein